MRDDWEKSAAAWIAAQGAAGDYTRRHVLDTAMLARIERREWQCALDIGCGEGRFCRLIRPHVASAIGIDPAPALIAEARHRDPAGDYRLGRAEQLDFADHSFDLVIAYLSLIDIDAIEPAIAELARVLAPGGVVLIANLNSFNTANDGRGWRRDWRGRKRDFPIDDYLTTRPVRAAWQGIDVVNWHRPLSTYLSLLIGAGLRLTHFDEPAPTGGDPARADAYRRVPYAHVMEWRRD
ncbi:class I SAM-dependent methyltransferase [Sphingomonas sp. 28-63-12]|uniref:class I SAM-dependent methyltransferase n=1 Tax=Sphingomonas sp. 28-63-12 TaxID=1970434 RepID=UPI000BCF5391|nr:MAG: SAM-dependent methyltransferase [Sphingomonas sp. 28-63-12]